jgi:hypothetical protein
MIAKAAVVLVLTALILGGLWLYGKLLTHAGRRASRRSNDAANEMTVNPPSTRRRGRRRD